MNTVYAILTSLLLSFVPSDVPYETIDQAFESNNAKSIVHMGKAKILINIMGKEGVYSQSQSSLILKDFFINKPNGTFEFFFKGKESAEGTFAIGKYISRGEEFRVTIHFKKIGGEYKIESLSIENS